MWKQGKGRVWQPKGPVNCRRYFPPLGVYKYLVISAAKCVTESLWLKATVQANNVVHHRRGGVREQVIEYTDDELRSHC